MQSPPQITSCGLFLCRRLAYKGGGICSASCLRRASGRQWTWRPNQPRPHTFPEHVSFGGQEGLALVRYRFGIRVLAKWHCRRLLHSLPSLVLSCRR